MAAVVNIKRENSPARWSTRWVSNSRATATNDRFRFLPGRGDNKIRIDLLPVLKIRALWAHTRVTIKHSYDKEVLRSGDLALVRRTHARTNIGGGRPVEFTKVSYCKLVLEKSIPGKRKSVKRKCRKR
jgi:hypothetical protein